MPASRLRAWREQCEALSLDASLGELTPIPERLGKLPNLTLQRQLRNQQPIRAQHLAKNAGMADNIGPHESVDHVTGSHGVAAVQQRPPCIAIRDP